MREHRRRDEKGCTHHGMLIPLFLPTPTHRESHGDILNLFSPNQWDENLTNRSSLAKTGRGEKKKKERKRNVEHKCVSRAGRRESLL